MKLEEQARIILEELDKQYTIPTYMEEYAIKGITAGLKRIEKEERTKERKKEADHDNE